jgi:hypothetical protein
MDNLRNIKKIVMAELKQNPVSRKSDKILYLEVCRRMGIDVYQPMDYLFITNAVPNPESVRRARQKVQAEHPEWKDEQTAENRANLEPEYIKVFAR